jgi:large subunit ribosomal protein L5
MNMREIRVEKVTLNMGCGTNVPVEQAKAILEVVSGRKVIITNTKKRSTFNVPKGKAIGCKTTLREGADEFLRKMLKARENKLKSANFDNTGNFSFGIKEYIDLDYMDYDPKLPILGFDVCVTLERPGYRVKRKRISKKLGRKHVITKDEAIEFAKKKFGVMIEEA